MKPWDYLFIGFNQVNFPNLFNPTWQIAVVLLILGIVYYNVHGRAIRNYAVLQDLNDWLMWSSLGIFSLILMFAVFQFDFLFVLPTMLGGAIFLLWVRFVRFPPLIEAYERSLARQRYFQRARASHPEATIRQKAPAKATTKRRRRR